MCILLKSPVRSWTVTSVIRPMIFPESSATVSPRTCLLNISGARRLYQPFAFHRSLILRAEVRVFFCSAIATRSKRTGLFNPIRAHELRAENVTEGDDCITVPNLRNREPALDPLANSVQYRPLWTVGIVCILAAVVVLPLAVPPNSATSPPTWGGFLPDGGETLPGGSYYNIRWNATHDTDASLFVTLTLSPGGFVTAGEFPTGGASWTWHVPTVNLPAARVRACAVAYDGSRGCRESSANFTVPMSPPYVGLVGPADGAENVPLGAAIELAFDPPPDVANTTW